MISDDYDLYEVWSERILTHYQKINLKNRDEIDTLIFVHFDATGSFNFWLIINNHSTCIQQSPITMNLEFTYYLYLNT